MSAETLGRVVENLLSNDVATDKRIAVIGQATTPEQRVVTCALHEYKDRFEDDEYISPTIAIIGKVVALNDHFGWLENNESPGEYFKQLAGNRQIQEVSRQNDRGSGEYRENLK